MSLGRFTTTEDSISEMQAKLKLLYGERKASIETRHNVMQKNLDTVELAKRENKDLKSTLKKLQKEVGGSNGEKSFQEKEYERLETLLHLKRQELDGLKATAKDLQKLIRKKGDKLDDFNKEKAPILTDDSPLTRQIRILENRLDKAMIKFNEAQSIKKTYEQILRRLKEERIGYDNQLQAIERTLKAKDKDYQELLNMSHDANYLRELAKNELLQARGEFEEVTKEKRKEIEEKKKYVEARVNLTTDLARKEASRRKNHDEETPKKFRATNLSQQLGISNSSYLDQEREKLQLMEEKWRKIKEVTGVDDANEVIQKCLSSVDTHKNLEAMTKESQKRIEYLTEKRTNLKAQLEDLKYSQSSGLGSRRIVDEFIQQLAEAQSKNERQKQQFERIAKILVNVRAGVEHLNEKMRPALQECTVDSHLRQFFLDEIAKGQDLSPTDEEKDAVNVSTISLGTQSAEEKQTIELLSVCYQNLVTLMEATSKIMPPNNEDTRDEGQEMQSSFTRKASETVDLNQSKNNIRIKLSEREEIPDTDSESEDDDKEAELISRQNVKKKAEKLIAKMKSNKKP
ncbi:hypothetical protein ABK040_015055 [Willaertia magna]